MIIYICCLRLMSNYTYICCLRVMLFEGYAVWGKYWLYRVMLFELNEHIYIYAVWGKSMNIYNDLVLKEHIPQRAYSSKSIFLKGHNPQRA